MSPADKTAARPGDRRQARLTTGRPNQVVAIGNEERARAHSITYRLSQLRGQTKEARGRIYVLYMSLVAPSNNASQKIFTRFYGVGK